MATQCVLPPRVEELKRAYSGLPSVPRRLRANWFWQEYPGNAGNCTGHIGGRSDVANHHLDRTVGTREAGLFLALDESTYGLASLGQPAPRCGPLPRRLRSPGSSPPRPLLSSTTEPACAVCAFGRDFIPLLVERRAHEQIAGSSYLAPPELSTTAP